MSKAGAYIQDETGVRPDLNDPAMAERNRGPGTGDRGKSKKRKTVAPVPDAPNKEEETNA